jgi:hypothetical protein
MVTFEVQAVRLGEYALGRLYGHAVFCLDID